MTIIWKPVKGFENEYLVSSDGQVASLPKRTRSGIRILKQGVRGIPAYKSVQLCKDGVVHKKKVHRLVAEAFVEKPEDCDVVNHKDRNKFNNNFENLEWCTSQRNAEHSLAKTYTLINPEGQSVEVFNLRKFSRELGIPHQYFYSLISGVRKNVKGWRLA